MGQSNHHFCAQSPQREYPTATYPSPQEIPMSFGRRGPLGPQIGGPKEAKQRAENQPKNYLSLSLSLFLSLSLSHSLSLSLSLLLTDADGLNLTLQMQPTPAALIYLPLLLPLRKPSRYLAPLPGEVGR